MNLKEKKISTQQIFNGEVLHVEVDTVSTPNGNIATREMVRHPGGVCIIAVDDDGNVIMERQYRHPSGEILLEIPAGKLNHGEDVLQCGKRELEEETGLKARRFIPMGKMYPTPGFCDEVDYIYLALDLYGGEANPDADEIILLEKIPLEKLCDMVMNNEISDAKTALAVLKAQEMKRRGMF